jgi:acetyl-CoA synthetase
MALLSLRGEYRNRENLSKEINQQISNQSVRSTRQNTQFVSGLPKTRSGKSCAAFYVKLRKETILILETYLIQKLLMKNGKI